MCWTYSIKQFESILFHIDAQGGETWKPSTKVSLGVGSLYFGPRIIENDSVVMSRVSEWIEQEWLHFPMGITNFILQCLLVHSVVVVRASELASLFSNKATRINIRCNISLASVGCIRLLDCSSNWFVSSSNWLLLLHPSLKTGQSKARALVRPGPQRLAPPPLAEWQ